MTVTITREQVLRIQRAMSEEFSFRLVKINGEAAVRVFSPKSGNEYTVRSSAPCDCLDKTYSPQTACKHEIGAALWIQRNPLEEMEREEKAARRANAARNLSADYPEGN